MAHFDTLIFDISNGVATITLNRPDAANGINLAMAQELASAAMLCDSDPEVRAVIITANGKFFSAGGDLKSFASSSENISALLKQVTFYLHGAISQFARMEAPVIIAVNGTAAGAGFSLAVAGDLVLSAESAKYTMAYTAAGLSPDGSASYFLPRLIGMRKTQELMITNRRISAQEALEWGAITRIVADNELQTEAKSLAIQIANGPTKAFGCVKKLLLESFDNGLETQLKKEANGIVSMTRYEDGREGVAAFMEKRPANFTGK